MRRVIALVTLLAMPLANAPLFAADAIRAARVRAGQGQPTGAVNGTAEDSLREKLAGHTVRIRNLANGNLAGSTTSGAAGEFSFTGLAPGNYAVEIVNAAGDIVGTSAAITVAAGATVNVTVTASAAAALAVAEGAAAGSAAAAGGAAAAHGISTVFIITAAAAAAGVVGIAVVANRSTASGSR